MDRENSAAAISQETLASLQQLEPSPVESPLELKEKYFTTTTAPGPPPNTSRLGLSGAHHGTVYYLTRLQRYSSYIFTLYTAIHLSNTSLIPLLTRSVPAAESYLLLTRPYYQSPSRKPSWSSSPWPHILSGLLLRIHRRNTSLARYGVADLPAVHRLPTKTRVWPGMSYVALSGYVFAPLVLGHAVVNRGIPWWFDGGSSAVGLGFVAHGFARHPVLAWMGYVGLVGVGSGHMVWGWTRWMGWMTGEKKGGNGRRWWVVNGVAALVAAVWMAGDWELWDGGLATGWVKEGFDELYAKVPFVSL